MNAYTQSAELDKQMEAAQDIAAETPLSIDEAMLECNKLLVSETSPTVYEMFPGRGEDFDITTNYVNHVHKGINSSLATDQALVEQYNYPNPPARDPVVLAEVTAARNRIDEHKRLNPKATAKDVESLLGRSVELADRRSIDAGSIAREALETFQQLRKNQRRKRIKFWLGWMVFLLLLVGVGVGGWSVMPNYVVSGRYSVVSDCKVPFGDTELTGKRTYSYAYKSLFGYHLVDESTKLERTEMNVEGSKLTILGQEGGKWWRQNIGLGERGTVVLKPADLYWFITDKNTALVPHSGLCK